MSDSSSFATSPSRSKSPSRSRSDNEWRGRIGRWREDALPDLSDFVADTNVVVRAAAGSGKTTALVARMVALIRSGHATPAEMAAITFTRKAAGEMKERFFSELQRTRQHLSDAGHDDSGAAERIDQALRTIEQGFIGTVHAFCGRMLREHALSIGLPPGFEVGIDDDTFCTLGQRVWHQYVTEQREQHAEQLQMLETLGLPLSRLASLFETISRHPELDVYTNAPDAAPDLSDAVEEAKAFVQTWNARRPSTPLQDVKKARKALGRAAAFLQHSDLTTPAEQARFLSVVRSGYNTKKDWGRVTLKAWGKSGTEGYKHAQVLKHDAYPELVQTHIDPVLAPWKAYAHQQAVAFVEPAAHAFLETRRSEGLLTHHDVLYWTRELLKRNPAVRTRIQERTPRLLVDEFQDTDPLQAEILFLLTSDDPSETKWRTCVPRPGSLFIVGDDKQSIYRFRRADINVFNAVVQRIEATGGEIATLSKNFRSHSQLLTFCDRAFGDLFADGNALVDGHDGSSPQAVVQADYVSFEPTRPAGQDDTSLRLLDTPHLGGLNADEVAQKEAKRIAAYIRHAVRNGQNHPLAGPEDDDACVFPGGASYGDFLILTRKKEPLSTYADALARSGIPFTITGSEDLGASEDVRDLVALCRYALRPDDPVACLAYLRSGLVGLSDTDLYRYRRAHDPDPVARRPFQSGLQGMPEAVVDALPDALAVRLTDAFERARRARRHLTEHRPSQAVWDVVEEVGLVQAAATPRDSAQRSLRAGRLLQALALAQRAAHEGHTIIDVVRLLSDMVHDETDEDSPTLETGSRDAVRVMNVHQAKGLEAPVVFLAAPKSRTNNRPTTHVRRTEEGAQLVAPLIKGTGRYATASHAPLGWETGREPTFKDLEKAHGTAEEHRLRYVAATRAKHLLVVSRTFNKGNKKVASGAWKPLAPFLDDIPALEVPSGASDDSPQSRPAPDVDAERAARTAALEEKAQPSYHETSASQEVKGDGPVHYTHILADQDGYGPALGTVVHNALEEMLHKSRTPDHTPTLLPPETIAHRLDAAEDALDREDPTSVSRSEQVSAVRRMLTTFRDSRLFAEACSAETLYTEYPFVWSRRPGDAPQTADDAPTILRGFIDLVYRDSTGWHIVDYKTDRIASPSDVQSLSDDHPYAQQVRLYAAAWRACTGMSVADAGLWFAETDTVARVDVAP